MDNRIAPLRTSLGTNSNDIAHCVKKIKYRSKSKNAECVHRCISVKRNSKKSEYKRQGMLQKIYTARRASRKRANFRKRV